VGSIHSAKYASTYAAESHTCKYFPYPYLINSGENGMLLPGPEIDTYQQGRYHPSSTMSYIKLHHCPRVKLLMVVALNADREGQDLDTLYRVEDNRLVGGKLCRSHL
jgi:hypothetical protein